MIIEVSKGQQISIPAKLREDLDLRPGTKLEIEKQGKGFYIEQIEDSWDDIFKEAEKYPCNLSPEELDELFEEEILRR